MQTEIRRALLAAMGLALLAAGVACTTSSELALTTPAPQETPEGSAPAPASAADGAMTVAGLVKLAEPSIVRVQTPGGVGSGFVVAADGYIVTNNHVVQGANGRTSASILVTMSDGAEHRATVVGTDARSDLALLKVEATGLKPLALANLAEVVVGQDVVAIGYALDLTGGEGPSFSVTRGIISAKNRGINEMQVLGAVQTDAAINHGNSGGPLIDMSGRVVGVNTAIAPDRTTGGIAAGIGFAVGSDTVRAVYEEIREKGKVDRGLLGIRNFEALRPAKARDLGIPETSGGVYLDTAADIPEGPALNAGLRAGDVIVRIAETGIRTEADLAVAMIRHHPGERVELEVYRDGKKQTLQITLGTPTQ